MAKTWAEITADQEFQGLPAADQETVREAFWQKRVAPTLGDADVEQARAYFDQRTRIRKQDLPSDITPSDAGAGRGLAARGVPTLGERMQDGLSAAMAPPPAQTGPRRGGVRSEMRPFVGGDEQIPAPRPAPSLLDVPTNPNMAFGEWSRGQRKMDDSVADSKATGTIGPASRTQSTAFDVEENLRDSSPITRGAVQGFAGLGKIGPGAARLAGDLLGIDAMRDAGARASQLASGTEQGAAEGLTGNDKLVASITSSIVNSTPTMLVGMGAGPALKALFATSTLQEYNTGRDTGFSPAESLGRAAIFGAAEALGERFGFPEQVKILKGLAANMPQGEVAKLFGAMLAKEIPGEQLTTAIQFMADKAGPAAQKPNATLADYLNDAAETFKVTVGQSLVMGGGPTAIQTARSTFSQVNQAQAAPEQRAAQAISDAAAAYYRPAPEATTPTAARADSLKRFDEAAAAWGLSPKAASAVREQAGSMPSDDVPGFLARVTAAFAKRGLYRKPVDEASVRDLDKRLRPPTDEPAQPEAPNVDKPDVDRTAPEPVGAGDGGGDPAARSGGTVGPVSAEPGPVVPPAGAPAASGGPADSVADGRGTDPALTSKRTPEQAMAMMEQQAGEDGRRIPDPPAFEDPASDDILSDKGKPWASKTLANRRLRDLPNGYRLARTAKGWVIKPEDIANPTETPAGGQPASTTKATDEVQSQYAVPETEVPSGPGPQGGADGDAQVQDQQRLAQGQGGQDGPGLRLTQDAAAQAADFEQDPLFPEFTQLGKAVSAAEKQSNPKDWTSEERAAYDSGNWREFSRLRGYTKGEIEQYARYIEVADNLVAKYGVDTVQGFEAQRDAAAQAQPAPEQSRAPEAAAPAYDQRNADRLTRIKAADSAEAAQAVLQEEYADGERHFEGTTRLERAARSLESDRQRAQESAKAKKQAEADYDSGKWVVDETLTQLFKRQGRESVQNNIKNAADFKAAMERAQAENPDREYTSGRVRGTSSDYDTDAVRYRKRQASPEPAPAEPTVHRTGSTVTLDGKRYTVAKTGKASVTLEGEDGKKRTVQVSAPTYAKIQTAEARTLNEDGRASDGKPINPGEVFRTASGRETTAYPKQKAEKYASQWLIDNAVAEAQARGDDFNATGFSGEKPQRGGELAPASRDSMLMYLFGEQPKPAPSILKPLVQKPAPAPQPEAKAEPLPKPSEKPSPKPSENTIVSDDAAERARALLRKKLGNINSGLDPEVLQAGITLAAYHVERGARKFSAYAKAMVDDLGDIVKPYLQSWYMAARSDPAYAALRDSMDKASAVEDLTAADIDAMVAPQAEAKPATPLYASRAVTNAKAIIDWARSQGFKSTLKPEDLHVTIAYSRDAVDGAALPKDAASLTASGGKRSVEPLGEEGAVVLKFNSPELQARWKAYRAAGASWDYDAYTPHVTITYDGKGVDLAKVQPYTGPIELGAEQQEPLNVNKKDDYKESSAPPPAEEATPSVPEPEPAPATVPAPEPAPEPAPPPPPARRAPKSFRKTVQVTTQAYIEESKKFEPREMDAETALSAIYEDIKQLKAFRACITKA